MPRGTAGYLDPKESLQNNDAVSCLSEGPIYEALFETAPDGILAVDEYGAIVLSNREAERMFGYTRVEIRSLLVEDLMPQSARKQHVVHRDHYNHYPRARPMGTHLNLVARRKNGTEFPVDIMLSPLQLKEVMLVISMIRDITERRKVEEERELLVERLRDALAKVKTLSGLLPICAWCKKIRDDKGYWTRLEEYIAGHSDADFTHGICPDCAAKVGAGRKKRRKT